MTATLPQTGKRITELSERLAAHAAMYDRALLRGNLEAMDRELAVLAEQAAELRQLLDPLIHVV